MLLQYYKLTEQPFGATPDPDYLYLSATHGKALQSLLYAIRNRRGFMSLVAAPGMGKTTLLLQMLKNVEGFASTAFLFQTMCGPEDLLRSVLNDLGVSSNGASISALQAELHGLLRAEAEKARRVVVVLDEAQNLNDCCLEVVRVLSNFETTREKLVQIVLAGQPQLREQLASPGLLQLRQRIAISARLEPFNAEETRQYIEHRLRVAGYSAPRPLFSPEALALIADRSEGIPRNINHICFTSLTLAADLKQREIQCEVVSEALKELDLSASGSRETSEVSLGPEIFASTTSMLKASPAPFHWLPAVLAVILLLLVFGWGLYPWFRGMSTAHLSAAIASMSASQGPSSQAATSVAVDSRVHPKDPEAMGSMLEPFDVPLLTVKEKVTTSERITLEARDDKQQSEVVVEDPAKLWELVKLSDSNAEVKLARMFMDGSGVDQNCDQAKILLLDASRKGNMQAITLLNGHSCQ